MKHALQIQFGSPYVLLKSVGNTLRLKMIHETNINISVKKDTEDVSEE